MEKVKTLQLAKYEKKVVFYLVIIVSFSSHHSLSSWIICEQPFPISTPAQADVEVKVIFSDSGVFSYSHKTSNGYYLSYSIVCLIRWLMMDRRCGFYNTSFVVPGGNMYSTLCIKPGGKVAHPFIKTRTLSRTVLQFCGQIWPSECMTKHRFTLNILMTDRALCEVGSILRWGELGLYDCVEGWFHNCNRKMVSTVDCIW